MSPVEFLPLLAQVLVEVYVMNPCSVADELKMMKLKLFKVDLKERKKVRTVHGPNVDVFCAGL